MQKNVVRYSELNSRKLKKFTLIKLHNKKYDSIIMDEAHYTSKFENEYKQLKDIKNILIDADKFECKILKIASSKVENVYFLNEQNLGGLTIPVDILHNNNLGINFYWTYNKCNIKEINLIYKHKVENINLEGIRNFSVITIVNNNDMNPFEININLEFDKIRKQIIFDYNGKK